jgi:hypothetical protein
MIIRRWQQQFSWLLFIVVIVFLPLGHLAPRSHRCGSHAEDRLGASCLVARLSSLSSSSPCAITTISSCSRRIGCLKTTSAKAKPQAFSKVPKAVGGGSSETLIIAPAVATFPIGVDIFY